MDIKKQPSGDVLEVKIKGRLDGYWADHLASELSTAVREGSRHIRLNMSEIDYMSSAGIRVLVQVYKQLKGIQGSFLVANPSEAVKSILELAGLKQLLASQAVAPTAASTETKRARTLERENVRFDVFDVAPGATLACRVVGDVELLSGCRFSEEHCRAISFPDSAMGVGLGAFGNTFADCQGRFGEFLAVAGAAAYLPTDGTNVPDYMLATGDFVPDVKALYAVTCEGAFASVAHFERNPDAPSAALAEIAAACLDVVGSDIVGISMIAESAGLMGASLRRSPALEAAATAPFAYPEVRQWLSFTAERAYPHSLALVVGIAARTNREALTPLVRPLGKESWPVGHFHAAAFSYRPLKKDEVDLKATVATLFETETLQSVLHLINDDREIAGPGQSEFVRGACWIGPISEVGD